MRWQASGGSCRRGLGPRAVPQVRRPCLRPAVDLLNRIDAATRTLCSDLGRRLRQRARLITARWPGAGSRRGLTGEMLSKRRRRPGDRVQQTTGGVRAERPADVITRTRPSTGSAITSGLPRAAFLWHREGARGADATQFLSASHTSIATRPGGPWRAKLEPLLRLRRWRSGLLLRRAGSARRGPRHLGDGISSGARRRHPVKEWTKGRGSSRCSTPRGARA